MNRSSGAFGLLALLPALILIPLLAIFGVKGMVLELTLIGAFVLLYLLFRFDTPMLGLALLLLGIGPFYWGIDLAGLPEVFVDEFLFLAYAGYAILSYFVLSRKTFSTGDPLVAGSLVVLMSLLLLGFVLNSTYYIAFRNFIETYVFGTMLYFLFVNEADGGNADFFINVITVMTLVLSLAMLVEKATSYNFFMSRVNDMLYLSPEVARITRGVSRPYVTFFMPSEAGTFVAMGLPFAIFRARQINGIWGAIVAALVLLALVINYTRGVWFAVAVTAALFSRRFQRHLLYLVPLALILTILIVSLFQDIPFVNRLTDPQNLMARFFYWELAWDVFKQHYLMGIGHYNFKEIYLDFVRTVSPDIHFDITQIFVADNVYLTTLVEAGLLGLAALLTFWTVVVVRLRRLVDSAGPDGGALPLLCLQGLCIYLAAGFLADVHLFTKATKFAFILIGLGFALNKAARRHGLDEKGNIVGESA